MLASRMRPLYLLAFMATLAPAQEDENAPAPVPAHDELGFPITFNDEIITESDVERSLSQKRADVPAITFKNQRDALLKRQIAEEIARRLQIEVPPQEVDLEIKRRIDMAGGEAKLYDSLAQQGNTLSRYRADLRRQILESKLRFMFERGIAPNHQNLLFWRIRPTPRETEIAWRNDPQRRRTGTRVKRLVMVVDLDTKTRKRLSVQMALKGKSQEWLREEVEKVLGPALKKVKAELAQGRPFEEVARERGGDVDAQLLEWKDLPAQLSTEPGERFLQQAKTGAVSEPLLRTAGGYRILKLVDRERPDERPPSDPEVARAYDERIRFLRAYKWQAKLQIETLDAATVTPERVREGMRKDILQGLREAVQRLAELGLH